MVGPNIRLAGRSLIFLVGSRSPLAAVLNFEDKILQGRRQEGAKWDHGLLEKIWPPVFGDIKI